MTKLLFAGQYTDPNNGLIYLRARWYDPATGQFMSVDPAESQTGAAYYYASDSPLTDSDPSGLAAPDPQPLLASGTSGTTSRAGSRFSTSSRPQRS